MGLHFLSQSKFLFGVKSLAGVKPVFKKAANEFKRIASEVFDQNRE